MSTRVSWKCNRSERLIMIPSSYSSPSSGCSSCSVANSGATAISGMSMGSSTSAGSGCGLWGSFGHVGQTLAPLDGAKVRALSDQPISRIAFNPFLSQNMSDEKRERQASSLRVLCSPVVHSIPEFLNLPPYNLGNGAPETSIELIQSTEEQIPPLCLVPQRTHVPIQHHVNE
jgi:hypothetical protein